LSARYGPEERKLLKSAAGQLYNVAVGQGQLPVDDPRYEPGGELHGPARLLLDLGLLVLDEEGERYLPADPAAVQSRVVVPLSREGADLLNESARWADVFSALGQTYRTSPRTATSAVTEVRGGTNINAFIQATVADCRRELITAQPHGRRPAPELAIAIERDIKALNRGIRMRTLYQHSARQSSATREYVSQVTEHGGEVRTLDEFFNRLIVIDRTVAIIPSSAGDHVAVAVHDGSLIDYLVDIFDRSWERGRPFTARDARSERSVASDVRAMTIRLLAEGHSDPASAKRLGVSTRTYAGYIAALKEEYGVQTRFQLGYAMGRALEQTESPGDPEGF
jgi:hypothetical protein